MYPSSRFQPKVSPTRGCDPFDGSVYGRVPRSPVWVPETESDRVIVHREIPTPRKGPQSRCHRSRPTRTGSNPRRVVRGLSTDSEVQYSRHGSTPGSVSLLFLWGPPHESSRCPGTILSSVSHQTEGPVGLSDHLWLPRSRTLHDPSSSTMVKTPGRGYPRSRYSSLGVQSSVVPFPQWTCPEIVGTGGPPNVCPSPPDLVSEGPVLVSGFPRFASPRGRDGRRVVHVVWVPGSSLVSGGSSTSSLPLWRGLHPV